VSCKTTVTLDDDLAMAARAYAKAHDRTIANLLCHALRQYMRRYPYVAAENPVPVRDKASEGKSDDA